jgi:hypothetical protein
MSKLPPTHVSKEIKDLMASEDSLKESKISEVGPQ